MHNQTTNRHFEAMRAIDDMSPSEIHTLYLKNMLSKRATPDETFVKIEKYGLVVAQRDELLAAIKHSLEFNYPKNIQILKAAVQKFEGKL